MARDTMTELIGNVRLKIGDAAGQDQTFTDDQIELCLDQNRRSIEMQALTPIQSVESGQVVYKRHAAEDGFWEKDASFYKPDLTDLTCEEESNFLSGEFLFADSQDEVLIFGRIYDVFEASALLCEAWAAKQAQRFDFGADSQNYKESQIFDQLTKLAESLRAQSLFGHDSSGAGTGEFFSNEWSANA